MLRRKISVFACAAAFVLVTSPVASAGLPHKGFGPSIDGYPRYQGQSRCMPAAKPGVVAFQSLLLRTFPVSHAVGISRACNVGGTSEHKEGRALDWGVNAAVPSQRKAAERVLAWLDRSDRYGNSAAMARRIGIMYAIWNRRIWFPGGGWRTYCVPKKAGCKEPGRGGGLRNPHTDHVHFSFTWDGARRRTTYWHKDMSMLAGMDAPVYPVGFWLAGRNGTVTSENIPYYDSGSGRLPNEPAVDIASTPDGGGYWLAFRNGRVKAYGRAPFRGSARGKSDRIVDITATPSGRGYWLLARGGRVLAFGDAGMKGGLGGHGSPVAGMASTPSGKGYWIVTARGRVAAFGDAVFRGGAAGKTAGVQGIVSTSTGAGYWLFTQSGRVLAFGDATTQGDLAGKTHQKVVGMARVASGSGYWLVGERGRIASFGQAPKLGRIARTTGHPSGAPVPDALPGD